MLFLSFVSKMAFLSLWLRCVTLRFFYLSNCFVHFFCFSKRNEPKKKSPEPTGGSSAQPKDNRVCFSPMAPSRFPLQKTEPGSHLFRFCPPQLSLKVMRLKRTQSKFTSYLGSIGLREFWDQANVLRLAAVACCKRYCLRRTEDDELYRVGKLQNKSPKII